MTQEKSFFMDMSHQTLRDVQEMASQWAHTCASQRGVILLSGGLGSGKTTWSRSFIQTLCGSAIDVPSPTFNLMLPYRLPGGSDLWHMDLYRLEEATPHLDEDISDLITQALCLIEWPERRPWLFTHIHCIATIHFIWETPETRRVVATWHQIKSSPDLMMGKSRLRKGLHEKV